MRRIIGRGFIDRNGGFQSERSGVNKLAHDAWVKTNSWNLSRDDFIRLSYFHGDMDSGSDGSRTINGSEDRPGDLVYISVDGSEMSRSTVSHWLNDCDSFMHGYTKCYASCIKHEADSVVDVGLKHDEKALHGSPVAGSSLVRFADQRTDPIIGSRLMQHSLPPDPVEFGNILALAG